MSMSQREESADEDKPGRDGRRAYSAYYFAGALLGVGFAVFTPSGPVEGTHLVVGTGLGLLLMLAPPRYRIPGWLVALAVLFLAASALTLLPRGLAGTQPWREAIEALGLDTGQAITPHFAQTLVYFCGLAALVVAALGFAGHRASSRAQHGVALGFTLVAGAYALLAMLAQDHGWRILWDFHDSFGFFPNRNHSATLMAMGGLCGLGVLAHAIATRRWLAAVLSGTALGILAWALLGYCGSRAGVLLLGLGFLLWLAGLGRRHLSARALVSAGVLGGLTLVLFFASDVAVKERLRDTLGPESENAAEKGAAGEIESAPTDDGDGGQQVARDDTPLDFRLVIYRDTAAMIAGEPWTGVGLGLFRHVFPQYREASASNALCLHPESDWLMAAAEGGVLAALLLAALTVGVLGVAYRRNRGTRAWPLRLGCLLGAAIVPFHGLFDVPGHRVGLALAALLLAGLVFRPSRRRRLGAVAVGAFRLVGTAIFLAGAYFLSANGFVGGASAITAAEVAADRVRVLHAEDQATTAAAAATVPEGDARDADDAEARGENETGAAAAVVDDGKAQAQAQAQDKLEQAIAVAEEGIARAALDPELHYLHGAMALYFDDKDALAERAFAIQRLLEPTWVSLPMRQASGWLPIDSGRALELWRDALARARRLAAIGDASAGEPGRVWSAMLAQAKGNDTVLARLPEIAGGNAEWLAQWLAVAGVEMRARELPGLLDSDTLVESARLRLLRAWHRLGNAGDAEAYAASRPGYGAIAW